MKTLIAEFNVQYASGFQCAVSLDVPLHGVTAIWGPSGCGKTTLLRCLAGLERAPLGKLIVGDAVWQDEAKGVFVPPSQRRVGYVFQEPRLFPHLTVKGNLEYGLRRRAAGDGRVTVAQVVALLSLDALLSRRPAGLSGGEQQRVAIGRALLTDPQILLMDEPFSSLDMERKREVLPLIQRLDQELRIPIVYVSHALPEVLQLASTVVFLRDGRVTGIGPLNEVFSQLDVRRHMAEHHIGAVVDAVVESHDSDSGLTRLGYRGQVLYVPRQGHAVGEHVRVHILSRDVSIVTQMAGFQSSVLNVLEGRIATIGDVPSDSPFVDVTLDVGWPLVATITKKSLRHLRLCEGQRVYAQIKTVAFHYERQW